MAPTKEKAEVPRPVREAYQRGFNDGLRQVALDAGLVASPDPRPCNTCAALSQLTADSLRHIRFVAQDGGKTIYAKAGIATPQYPRHYLLYVATGYATPADFVPGLLDKVHAFHEGRLRPSPDTYDR